MGGSKVTRGNASQFLVAGELCRRGYAAVVTMGNTPNTDVLVSNIDGTSFAHVQVKTFKPGNRTCSVGQKAERDFGDKFFWVLVGLPEKDQDAASSFYVIPSEEMAKRISANHKNWRNTTGKDGRPRGETSMRVVVLPPKVNEEGWDISPYLSRWDLIEEVLDDE